ncbi:hypothetical protein LF887_17610 [Chryseobacterium sp. MEBOG06]|uniref:hypothetical protein n=1 Tax=unclassified Chryseobacterium TaxID=2593645 RepID=UPI001F2FE7A7|nr:MULTISPECIES: hypothetical protein [unclassified Chryseobacterium]UKB82815.1 hypothetical protein LF887_17610 [Chryseobacterium sp. MEBOG06]
MGFDITYHPIKEQEIQKWYFDVLNDISLIEKLAVEYNIDDYCKEKYEDIILTAKEVKSNEFFDSCHGRYISLIHGFFRTYYYTRDSAFSFLIDQNSFFKRYTKSWKEIVGEEIENPVKNKITENYSSGVFIPADQVYQLLDDYQTDDNIREELNEFYSDERILVFIKALEFSKQNKMGLLEAADVVEPNPMEFNTSLYYSNMYNCDQEGVFLYVEAAMKRTRRAEELKSLNQKNINIYDEGNIMTKQDELKEKKGFWKKLFG